MCQILFATVLFHIKLQHAYSIRQQNNSHQWFIYTKGSVYFTGDILAATDLLELLCQQSKIRSRGMTQYKEKGHLVRKILSCLWFNG